MIRFILFLIVVTSSICCKQDSVMVIEYDLSCNEYEVVFDVKNSIAKTKKLIESNGISLREVSHGKCGYILKNNSKISEINSALTDIDLLNEIKTFFDIDLVGI